LIDTEETVAALSSALSPSISDIAAVAVAGAPVLFALLLMVYLWTR